jgi:hypothetical protein
VPNQLHLDTKSLWYSWQREADEVAKEATYMDQVNVPWNIKASKARIKNYFNSKMNLTHERTKRIYNIPIDFKAESQLDRQDQVDIARMRTGHLPVTLHFNKKIDPSVDDTCELCNMGEGSPEHIITSCPALQAKRMEILGGPTAEPSIMVSRNPWRF